MEQPSSSYLYCRGEVSDVYNFWVITKVHVLKCYGRSSADGEGYLATGFDASGIVRPGTMIAEMLLLSP